MAGNPVELVHVHRISHFQSLYPWWYQQDAIINRFACNLCLRAVVLNSNAFAGLVWEQESHPNPSVSQLAHTSRCLSA